MEFIRSLDMGAKLSPWRNPQVAWMYLFLSALVAYLSILTSFINEKPLAGSVLVIDKTFASTFLESGRARVEAIVSGLNRTDGPLWVEEDEGQGYLVFSDSMQNRVYKWEDGKGFFTVGKTILLKSAGCFKNETLCEELLLPGTAGLLRAPAPAYEPSLLELFAAQHGERSIGFIHENGTQIVSHVNVCERALPDVVQTY